MKTPHNKTVALNYVQGILDFLSTKDIDLPGFLATFSLDEAVMQQEGKRLELSTFSKMFDEAERLAQDKDIGLHVGEGIKPGHYGVLGYSVMSCTYFEEALERHLRYQNLVADIGCAILSKQDDETQLLWDTGELQPSRHVAEHNLAAWVTYARWIGDQHYAPLRIGFEHSAPDNLTEHERIFACPVLFDQANTTVTFPTAFMRLPLPQKDTAIRDMMDKHAERLLAKLETGESFVNEVHRLISQSLENGKCELDDIAAHFEMSGRTFQRKLKELNLSYQHLLDTTRKELALGYINDARIDLSELAFLLGFCEQSTFQRAFKRWTNSTPGKYRKLHSAQ